MEAKTFEINNVIKNCRLIRAAKKIEDVISAMPEIDNEEDALEYVSIEMQLRDIQERLTTLAQERRNERHC